MDVGGQTDTIAGGIDLHRLLVQTVSDYAIFALDRHGHILTWNEGARRLKGYSAGEIVGKHFSTFYPRQDVEAGKPKWELEVAVREGKYEEEGWRVRKDGSLFWASVLITTLRDESGAVVGFAKVTRDLTERRAAQERALDDARRIAEIESANRTKSEFLAAMSHELRTPLNAIGGYVELMEVGVGGPVTERQREYLTRIRNSQQHLLGIITDLLNYSRIEAGHVTYEIAPISVHNMVETVVPLIEPQAIAREITLRHGRCDQDVVALADRARSEQIMLNLLGNAVKFTPHGGLIVVTCNVEGRRVAVSVKDTGPGIPLDKQAAVFEPFVQLGRNLTSPHEGTGLGLPISRDMARAMKGDVTVQSDGRTGSTFTLWLPKDD